MIKILREEGHKPGALYIARDSIQATFEKQVIDSDKTCSCCREKAEIYFNIVVGVNLALATINEYGRGATLCKDCFKKLSTPSEAHIFQAETLKTMRYEFSIVNPFMMFRIKGHALEISSPGDYCVTCVDNREYRVATYDMEFQLLHGFHIYQRLCYDHYKEHGLGISRFLGIIK